MQLWPSRCLAMRHCLASPHTQPSAASDAQRASGAQMGSEIPPSCTGMAVQHGGWEHGSKPRPHGYALPQTSARHAASSAHPSHPPHHPLVCLQATSKRLLAARLTAAARGGLRQHPAVRGSSREARQAPLWHFGCGLPSVLSMRTQPGAACKPDVMAKCHSPLCRLRRLDGPARAADHCHCKE